MENLCTEDTYSSGFLVLSHLGLAFVLVLTPFIPELVMSTDLLSFNFPTLLLFSFDTNIFEIVLQIVTLFFVVNGTIEFVKSKDNHRNVNRSQH